MTKEEFRDLNRKSDTPDTSSSEKNTPLIRAGLIEYNGRTMIRLDFKYEKSIIEEIRAIRGRIWSVTHKCWYVPDTSVNRRRFSISDFETPPNLVKEGVIASEYQSVCQPLLDAMRAKIILKAYSSHTLKNYMNHIKTYLVAISKTKNPLEVTKSEIEEYLLKRHENTPTSESDRNCHINAVKFLYEQVLGHERMLFYLPRPEKPLQLPKVLGEHELERMFRAVSNLKHKAILLTAFSCGLRVSEVVRIKVRDIDSERMQVFIERSKGKKDRYVTLSPVLLDILRQYVRLYKPTPKVYLFEGQKVDEPYSTRSAQTIFNRAIKAAGINKDVTFHALRHTFATHLLEKGVDIKYIKELLGHFDIKTTERYLHVAREKLIQIKSPLDYLDPNIF
ncbi:MAG: tyrosine-type recombinase/integrase [Saprospiraceae bacterium]